LKKSVRKILIKRLNISVSGCSQYRKFVLIGYFWLGESCCLSKSRKRSGVTRDNVGNSRLFSNKPSLFELGWRHGVVVSGVRCMNEVNPHRARLVLGWMGDRLWAGIPSRYATSQLS